MTMTISRAAMDALLPLLSGMADTERREQAANAFLSSCTVVEPPAASAEAQPASDGDWPEDFIHENGNYTCRCVTCGREFIGHKRRVTCRVCAKATTTPALREVTDGPMSDARALEIAQGAAAHMGNDYIDLLRALDYIRARLSTAQGMPDGWNIQELGDGFVHVEAPDGRAVNIGYAPDGDRMASALLRDLAIAVLPKADEEEE